MRFRSLILAALLACVGAAGVAAQQQFTLLATIVDPATGAPPDTLTADEIRVLEDGVSAKVLKVEAANRKVDAQILIDNGVGIGATNLSELRSGVRKLVEALPEGVNVTMVTTAPQPRFLVRATSSRAELLKGVDRLTLDSGAGRFTESIIEAVDRARKQKDTYTVVLAAGTNSGDAHIRTEHVKELAQKLEGQPMMIHVLLYGGERSATAGEVQIAVGELVTKQTGGRYEYINAMQRYVSLLPEFGVEVARQLSGNTRQFRITAQRPDGKSGKLGRTAMSAGSRTVIRVLVE
jgi:hypothetical protein